MTGTLKMDVIDVDAVVAETAGMGVVVSGLPGEGGTPRMCSIAYTTESANALHAYVKKNWASIGDGEEWAEEDAHCEIEGWSDLHRHVTGREANLDA